MVFGFSWGHFNSQEKLKTTLMQNFGVTNKEHYGMLWYFWSGLLTSGVCLKNAKMAATYVILILVKEQLFVKFKQPQATFSKFWSNLWLGPV